MAIKKYRKGAPSVLSAYFKSTEFDCSGSGCCSETLIDETLLIILGKVRQRFGPVIITSGYRCKGHNKEIGGASSSKHLSGCAADIKVKGKDGKYVDPIKVAVFIDSLYNNRYGIEVGSFDSSTGGYVHVDTRSGKWRAIRGNINSQKYDTVSSFFPTVRMNSTGAAVMVLSRKLKGLGYFKKTVSSTCGADLQSAIISFQRDKRLTVDGIAGPKTWAKIIELI